MSPSIPPLPRAARASMLGAGLLVVLTACGGATTSTVDTASPPTVAGDAGADGESTWFGDEDEGRSESTSTGQTVTSQTMTSQGAADGADGSLDPASVVIDRSPAEALEVLDGATESAPDDPEVHFYRGQLLLEAGRNEEAIAAFAEAIRLGTDHRDLAEFHLAAGEALAYVDRPDDALDAFTAATEIDDVLVDAQRGRFDVLIELGRLDEARVVADTLAAIARGQSEPLRIVGDAHRDAGDFDKALSSYDAALVASPTHGYLHDLRSVVLRRLGRHDEAYRASTLAIESDPSAAFAYFGRALSLIELGRIDESIEDLDAAVELDPSNADIRSLQAIQLRRVDRLDEALLAAESARDLDTESPDIRITLAWMYAAIDRQADALVEFETAERLGGSSAELHRAQGLMLRGLDRDADALVAFTKAATAEPGVAENHIRIGQTNLGLGDADAARTAFERALTLDPGNTEAQDGLDALE